MRKLFLPQTLCVSLKCWLWYLPFTTFAWQRLISVMPSYKSSRRKQCWLKCLHGFECCLTSPHCCTGGSRNAFLDKGMLLWGGVIILLTCAAVMGMKTTLVACCSGIKSAWNCWAYTLMIFCWLEPWSNVCIFILLSARSWRWRWKVHLEKMSLEWSFTSSVKLRFVKMLFWLHRAQSTSQSWLNCCWKFLTGVHAQPQMRLSWTCMILRAFAQMSICHRNRARYTGQLWVFVYMLLRKDLISSIVYVCWAPTCRVRQSKRSTVWRNLSPICNIQVTWKWNLNVLVCEALFFTVGTMLIWKNTMAQHHPKRAISLKYFLIQIGVRPECRVAALVVAWSFWSCICSYCRAQQSVSLSSMEAEVLAATGLLAEVFYLKQVIQFAVRCVVELSNNTVVQAHLYMDSTSGQQFFQRLGPGRAKHLSVRILWTQSALRRGWFFVHRISTKFNPSDLNTKILSRERREFLCNLVGFVSSVFESCLMNHHVSRKLLVLRIIQSIAALDIHGRWEV